MIQADGYNPLVIEGSKFVLTETEALDKIMSQLEGEADAEFRQRLQKAFTPGEIAVLWITTTWSLKLP
ncbi:MAG: hypothetical protein ACLFUK_05320 [Halanaerobium sp.]